MLSLDFASGSDGKESACNVGDQGLIPGLGRSPGEAGGYLLQYSCLENPMERGAWWATVTKGGTGLSHFLLFVCFAFIIISWQDCEAAANAQPSQTPWWLSLPTRRNPSGFKEYHSTGPGSGLQHQWGSWHLELYSLTTTVRWPGSSASRDPDMASHTQ